MNTDTTTIRQRLRVSARATLAASAIAFSERVIEVFAENAYLNPICTAIDCRDAADKLWALRCRDTVSQDAARECADVATAIASDLRPAEVGRAILLIANYARLCDQVWDGWDVEPSTIRLALRLAVCELRRIERERMSEANVVEQKHVARITPRALVMRPFRCIRSRTREPSRARARARRSHRVVAAKAATDPDSSDGDPPGDRARLRAVPVAEVAHESRGAT